MREDEILIRSQRNFAARGVGQPADARREWTKQDYSSDLFTMFQKLPSKECSVQVLDTGDADFGKFKYLVDFDPIA